MEEPEYIIDFGKGQFKINPEGSYCHYLYTNLMNKYFRNDIKNKFIDLPEEGKKVFNELYYELYKHISYKENDRLDKIKQDTIKKELENGNKKIFKEMVNDDFKNVSLYQLVEISNAQKLEHKKIKLLYEIVNEKILYEEFKQNILNYCDKEE